jgi:hypothetical protein
MGTCFILEVCFFFFLLAVFVLFPSGHIYGLYGPVRSIETQKGQWSKSGPTNPKGDAGPVKHTCGTLINNSNDPPQTKSFSPSRVPDLPDVAMAMQAGVSVSRILILAGAGNNYYKSLISHVYLHSCIWLTFACCVVYKDIPVRLC